MDPAHDVHDLRHVETNGDAAQSVGIEPGEIGMRGEEVDGIPAPPGPSPR